MEDEIEYIYDDDLIVEGWRCPMCGKVYSPYINECSDCNEGCRYETTSETTLNKEYWR